MNVIQIRLALLMSMSQLLILPGTAADSFPPPTLEVRTEIEGLLLNLPTAEPSNEDELMERLLALSKDFALLQTALDLSALPEGKAVLSRVIPFLISRLDGPNSANAYTILISIQGKCPAPKREIWEEWWRRSGHKDYEDGIGCDQRELNPPKQHPNKAEHAYR